METHPPAWLPDPLGRYQYRYWDGTRWTSTVSTNGSQETDPHGVAPNPLAPMDPTGFAPTGVVARGPRPSPEWSSTVRTLVLGGALVTLVGSVLPWVKAEAGLFSVTKNGLDGDGALTLCLAIALGLVFVLGRARAAVAWITLGFAALVLAIALYDVVDIHNTADDLADNSPFVHVSATVGVGLWLVLAGGVLAFAGGLVALLGPDRQASRAR